MLPLCGMTVRFYVQGTTTGTWLQADRLLFRASSRRYCIPVGMVVPPRYVEQSDPRVRKHRLRSRARVHGKEAEPGRMFGICGS